MVNRRKSLLLLAPVIVILAVALTFPTSAFTTTTLERGVTVSVASDDQGLVALIDGHPGGGVVEQTQQGSLSIDFRKGGANGANVEAEFTLGDPSNPTTNQAFRIVNQGTQERDFTFTYTLHNPGQDGSGENVRFELFRSGGPPAAAVVSETTGGQTITSVGVGESLYVVVKINTIGVNQAQNTDLSGTLEIVAGDGGA